MNTLFCPKCGESFSSSDCIEQGELLRCPQCTDQRVMVQGRVLVAVGLVILFTSTQIPYVPALGVLIGGGTCVMGMVRSLRQRRARSKMRSQDDDPIEEPIDDLE